MKYRVAICTFLVGPLLAACGTARPAASTPSASMASPSAGAPSPTGSMISQTEAEAKVVANAPPRNLVWQIPNPPSEWRSIGAGTGRIEWQVGRSRCAVFLDQPGGFTGHAEVTDDYLAKRAAINANAGPITVRNTAHQFFDNTVNAPGVTVATKFSTMRFSSGNTEGQSWAHRSGDFGLVALVECGGGQWRQYDTQLTAYIAGLSARTTY